VRHDREQAARADGVAGRLDLARDARAGGVYAVRLVAGRRRRQDVQTPVAALEEAAVEKSHVRRLAMQAVEEYDQVRVR